MPLAFVVACMAQGDEGSECILHSHCDQGLQCVSSVCSAPPDAGTPDAGVVDAGSSDAGSRDAGDILDTGSVDAAGADSGPTDVLIADSVGGDAPAPPDVGLPLVDAGPGPRPDAQ
jgi:hypothetical protein